MIGIRKCSCLDCKNEITVNQLKRHLDSKQCKKGKVGFKKLEEPDSLSCPFCEKECKNLNSFRNHSRCCSKNPNRNYKNGMMGKPSHKKGKTKEIDEGLMKQSITLKERIKRGELIIKGRPHSNKSKEKMSIIASERLAKHSKYSENTEYKPGVILESSYEVRVAKILDILEVDWIKVRQGYIWDDNGKKRRYVPDFYLPKQNIFLDPKNDYLVKKDKRKIKSAMEINNIKVIVLSNDLINEEFIEFLVL